MKIVVISDIHGNLEAFGAVLKDLAGIEYDAIVSLGDNIGYGPNPEEVIGIIRERNIPSVMGNHELAVAKPEYLYWFNTTARLSIQITFNLMSRESVEYVSALEPALTFGNGLYVHGCPPDSVTRYLFEASDRELFSVFSKMKERICFVGHTHELECVSFDGKDIVHSPLYEGLLPLREDNRYIMNIGSVGQPRDGNNNAKYVVWDNSEHTLELRFVPYDIARTADNILRLGFPRINAQRLW